MSVSGETEGPRFFRMPSLPATEEAHASYPEWGARANSGPPVHGEGGGVG